MPPPQTHQPYTPRADQHPPVGANTLSELTSQQSYDLAHTQPRLVAPLDLVELPRRLSIVLRVLPAHRQTLRMPPTNIAPNHPLVRNIFAHLTFQVRFKANSE